MLGEAANHNTNGADFSSYDILFLRVTSDARFEQNGQVGHRWSV